MVKKRIIGVITIRDDTAVQSFGYNRYLPLGKPEFLAVNFDRWGVDEILLLDINRTQKFKSPNIELIQRIASSGISTPVIYGGGIMTEEHAVNVIRHGADRLVIDGLINSDFNRIAKITESLGAQAIIAGLPLTYINKKIHHHDYIRKNENILDFQKIQKLSSNLVSELLIVDPINEGMVGSYDENLIDAFCDMSLSLIAFGGVGVSTKANLLLGRKNVAGIAIGNQLNYEEHAIQHLRQKITNANIRKPIFQTSGTY